MPRGDVISQYPELTVERDRDGRSGGDSGLDGWSHSNDVQEAESREVVGESVIDLEPDEPSRDGEIEQAS